MHVWDFKTKNKQNDNTRVRLNYGGLIIFVNEKKVENTT